MAAVIKRIRKLERAGHSVHIYPDAERFIEQRLLQRRLTQEMELIRENPTEHPLRSNLLNAELLPYQMDGIAFAVSAGRAVLADDMGPGKTIQGIGVAELFARLADISGVSWVAQESVAKRDRSVQRSQ